MKAKPGCEGVVIHADVFHRDSEQKDDRAKEIAKAKEEEIRRFESETSCTSSIGKSVSWYTLLKERRSKQHIEMLQTKRSFVKGRNLTVEMLNKLELDEFENLGVFQW